ncbi:uncharacterized protein [Montipora foliosa]|uniref:uncharacterized protein n=1 Tax=Montipora foliosa TaxID=591990 RepID=UPI0035F0FE7D
MQMMAEQEKTEMEPLVRQLPDIAQYPDFVKEGDQSGSGELSEPNVYGEESDSCGEANETNESDDQPMNERANLTEIIEDGDIDDISDNLTPKALTNFKDNKNVLMMAMETSFNLRRHASKKGPSEEDFTKLANSVDKFSTCLLDPLKSQIEARHAFGDSIDDVMDAAINLEQKELLAHPVLFNLLANKWFGKFDKLNNTSSSTFERLQWIFLNFWCLFDLVMFPLFFALLYVWNKLFAGDQKLENREMEVAFLMSTTSDLADDVFEQIKIVVEQFIEEHGNTKDGYHIIIHDKISHAKTINAEEVQDLKKGKEEYPALHRNLKIAAKCFFRPRKSDVDKVIIYFTDDRVSLKRKLQRVQSQAESLGKEEINLLPVGIDGQIDIKELKDITKFNKKDLNVIHVGEYENPETVRKIIWHELQGKRIYERYLEYFTTPYFIFVRDTLSYVALLALHFALCLSPSSLPLSGLEWAILVFFLGRILMEIQQIVTIRKKEKESIKRDKESKFARKSTAGKYFSDRWNVLDFITLLIYVPTLILRIITWSLSNSVTNNRAIVIGGYLYGVNTMLLTLRAFGHVMETIKGVGVVQIALFHIIGDIAIIMWQFIAAILAFSISITKVYMAERSYISKESHKESLVCETPGLSCWWTVVEHLCWSLLGMSELDPLDSVDHPSETIARFLFGLFLVLGVILLINMMIALLSNTYQRVQDNSLREWSFKKAVTIQTYSNYHPVPVPFNIFWCLWLLCRKCYQRCVGCRERQGDANEGKGNNSEGKRKSLDFVVRNLQMKYFGTYGNSFPVTDDAKIDQIFHETRQNQQMTNQLAYGTFMTSASDESALPVGQEERE